jgi:catechol 2,3-dioxygenase-like lactoylglutathione lyase family enzyme
VIMPLRYTGIRVRDLKRSLRFYTNGLRLREIRRGDLRKWGAGIWVLLEDPQTHQHLELNWYPPKSEFAARYTPGEALDHIGFLLGKVSASRLESEYHRLLRLGARPTEIDLKRSGGWVADVTDPDGNWIELFRWPTPAETRKERAAKARRKRGPRSKKRR